VPEPLQDMVYLHHCLRVAKNSHVYMSKSKYIQPKITAVDLDPKSAILAACAVGGLYLTRSVSPHCGTGIAIGPQCVITPKGGAGGNTIMFSPVQYDTPS